MRDGPVSLTNTFLSQSLRALKPVTSERFVRFCYDKGGNLPDWGIHYLTDQDMRCVSHRYLKLGRVQMDSE